MPRATKEEALETRSRILDAAEDVFHRNGVAHTSLADVAAAAGVTRGAVYWHFKNKADLFNAMCERVRLPMEEMISAAASEDTADPLAALRESALFCLRQATTNPHSHKVFDIVFHRCEFVDELDPVHARQRDAMLHGRAQLATLIEHAVRRNQLPADLDIPLAAAAFQSHVSGLMNVWLFVPQSFDLAGEAERLIDSAIGMLRYAPALRMATAGGSADDACRSCAGVQG
ncbi:MAG TPA: TetR family transcriptional regulator [Noviherbaspirillum sp.]|nr:TetR family transcriptional regulator [Noviherbaspirillum sp.]